MIIVGASGLIGSALFAAARALPREVIGTCYSHENKEFLRYDLLCDQLGPIVAGIRPEDTVYLLSAYTNISWIYANQVKARELNLHATKRLIDEIAKAGARIIFMSSVEVFDGEQGNYNEQSLPHPLSLYGRMKFEIEEYLLKKKYKSCIVRTGWNVGWNIDNPCVIKLTYKALMTPGAKMAQDNIFSIIDVRDTCEGLLRLFDRPDVALCHLASASITRTQLASMIMNFSKYKEQMSYETVLFSDIRYPEKRGRNNQIDNSFAVSSLGMNFMPLKDIIHQKVILLDRYIERI